MSNLQKHPSVEELTAFNVGLLPPENASIVERHISDCEPCCETLLNLASDDTFVGLLQQADGPDDALTMNHPSSADSMGLMASSSVEAMKELFADHPRYEVISRIARGGMGVVFKAKHRNMKRTVALKVIDQSLIRDSKVVERFHREVQTAARLSHPNIVTAHDADQANDNHFLVMEHVDGESLAALTQRDSPISIQNACQYISQVANGLQYAHGQGVVHRDIKPHNLMLSDETVKILDFGLASLAELAPVSNEHGDLPENSSLTAACSIMGTPDFMSPEQATTTTSQVDFRSDIYSLGATFYYLLAGQPPFASGSVAHRLKSLANSEPTPIQKLRTDVSQNLADVISRMMAKDPDSRFQSAQEVETALLPFVENAPPRPTKRVQSSSGRRNWWPINTVKTISAAAAALLLILAGVVFVVTDNGTLVIKSVDDTVKVVVSQGHDDSGGTFIQTDITDTITGSKVKRLRSGEYKLSLVSDENKFELSEGGFVLRQGEEIVVTVSRKQTGEPKPLKKMALTRTVQEKLMRGGHKLSTKEIKTLQDEVESDPDDVKSRLQLLGYYSRNCYEKKELRETRLKLITWLIRNYPASPAAREADALVMGTTNPLGYVKAKEVWLEQVNTHDQNAAVHLNAAAFFMIDDHDRAAELLEKALALEPDSNNTMRDLADLYQMSKIIGSSDSKSRDQTDEVMTKLIQKRDLGSGFLIDNAQKTYKFGRKQKAKKYGESLLAEFGDDKDAVHNGNTLLGLLSVREGEIEAAKKNLIESGTTTGSAVLVSYGPSMNLAKALLDEGQQDIVLEYFGLCEKFWSRSSRNKLAEWKEAVTEGETPNFGANLWQFEQRQKGQKQNAKATPKALKKMAFPEMAQGAMIRGGRKLSENKIKELRAKADSDPNDVASRLQLLGYYSRNSIITRSLREPHQKLAIWFIENYPDSAAAGDHGSRVMASMNPLGYVRASEIWLEKSSEYDQNAAVLTNAAGFFLLADKDQAEKLYKKAQTLEPDNAAITNRLAFLYRLSGNHGRSKSKNREQNEKAMAQYERALKQTADRKGKSRIVIEMAKIAFKLQQMDKTKTLADRLLKEYSSNEDAVHQGNTLLGLLALEAGKTKAANKYLIESGKTKGSPSLNSTGPSMSLANALLEKGQQDTVLEYFELCEKFWTYSAGKKKLEAWKKAVEAGKTPDFKQQVDVTAYSTQTSKPAKPEALELNAEISKAVTALVVGQSDECKKIADRLLEKFSGDGYALHNGNTVLGLLAVQAGEIEAANKYLIESGKQMAHQG